MLTITFRNDGTGDGRVGNYDVVVRVNSLVIAERRIEGHDRAEGWRGLVRMLLDGDMEGGKTGG